jgi:hypothetical protein
MQTIDSDELGFGKNPNPTALLMRLLFFSLMVFEGCSETLIKSCPFIGLRHLETCELTLTKKNSY